MKVKQLSCVCVCARAVLAIYISAVILLLQCENEKLNEILAEAEILRSFFVYMWCKGEIGILCLIKCVGETIIL